MMPFLQTPVGLHARPQDLRLLGRLLFLGIFVFGFLASDPSRTPSRKDLED